MGIIVWSSFDLGCRKLENLVWNRVGPGLRAAQPHQKLWGDLPLTQAGTNHFVYLSSGLWMSLQIFAIPKKNVHCKIFTDNKCCLEYHNCNSQVWERVQAKAECNHSIPNENTKISLRHSRYWIYAELGLKQRRWNAEVNVKQEIKWNTTRNNTKGKVNNWFHFPHHKLKIRVDRLRSVVT